MVCQKSMGSDLEKTIFGRFNGSDLGNGARVTYHNATRLRAGRPGFRIRQGQKILTLLNRPRPSPGPTQTPIQWGPGTVCRREKRSEREAGHSLLCSVEVRMSFAIPPLPSIPSWCAYGDKYIFFFF